MRIRSALYCATTIPLGVALLAALILQVAVRGRLDFHTLGILGVVTLGSIVVVHLVVRKIGDPLAKQTEELRKAHDDLEYRVRQRTAALEQERYLLHALMDNLPHCIYFKDASSRFIRVNRGMAAVFRLKDASEIIGKSDVDFFTDEHAQQAMADEKEIMRSDRPVVDKEEKETWPDGRQTWALTTKMALHDEHGNVVGTFGISRDITERFQAAEALRVAKEAAEAASRAKSVFLANMSHEIRTPLNAIIGMSELILTTSLSARQREFLMAVRDSGEVLLSVINDILDFSKIEASKLVLDQRPFDIRDSLGDTLKSFALRAHRQGLELACHIRSDVPDFVVGDYNRLRQIIVNLVGNAIKFTDQGEVVVEVAAESRSDDDVLLHFTVADTGIGVPIDKRTVIFEMFEQADNTLTRRYGGTGLGLAIASRLVELMGGRIWIESEVGQGSRFHFTANLGIAREDPSLLRKPDRRPLEGLRVLIVDDNATNRRILEEVLRNWRMEPMLASSAAEAVERLKEARAAAKPVDLVLTDAHMPDTDGFTLAAQIKQDDRMRSTVVMMLTSGDRIDDSTRCEEIGIAGYLLKPIKHSELLDAIHMALGTSQADPAALQNLLRAPESVGPLSILLAEDSLVNQKLAVALLETQGHRIRVANHGKEALAAIQSEKFDLVLMDVQMPEMDGFETVGAIRALERRAGGHLPVVAMTAHAMKGDCDRCMAAGMDGYIAKPIHAKELFELIESVIGEARTSAASGGRALCAASVDEAPIIEAAPAETLAESIASPVTASDDRVDWTEALACVRGNPVLLRTVVEVALEEIPRLTLAIRQAIEADDSTALRLAAHTLKGSLRYFGKIPAFDIAFRLEQLGQSRTLADAPDAATHLEAEVVHVVEAFREHLESRTPCSATPS